MAEQDKGYIMVSILIPFVSIVIVVVGFYLLGCIAALLGFLFDFFDANSLVNMFAAIVDFLFLFSGEYPIGSTVVAVLVWIIVTAFLEIWAIDN